MKDKDVQILINKYLDGITTPEEERRLAAELLRTDIPKEWEIVRLMLGELTLGEAAYDSIMAERQSQHSNKHRKLKWRWAAIAGAAASFAVILLLVWSNGQFDGKPVTKVNEQKDVRLVATDNQSKIAEVYDAPDVETLTKTLPVNVQKTTYDTNSVKKSEEDNLKSQTVNKSFYEDTLGSGIWKDDKKVMIAIEMLIDCEKTIKQSSKAIRNGVVEASFKALPQRSDLQLVIDEGGNYIIKEDTQPAPIEL